jgi:prepilin-type N-terminal cleavage/methylation domain-containing protein
MRKGYMLVELLVAIAILAIISIPMSEFTKLLVFDIPMSVKHIEANTSLLDVIASLKSDICSSFKLQRDSKNRLIMQMTDETVCYTFGEDKISRSTTDGNDPPDEWMIPGGRIDFEIQQINDTPAVSVTKYVEVKTYRGIEKKMAETYLFFPNVFQEDKK